MSLGKANVFSVTMLSGTSLSNEVDLSRAYSKVYLEVGAPASEVRLRASVIASAAGGTYRQVYHPSINSSTVGANVFKIPSAASLGIIEIPAGLQFLKVETTAAIANGQTFKIICSDV